jgi:SET domain
VAGLCLQRGALEKTDTFERIIFAVDVLLTVSYSALTWKYTGDAIPFWLLLAGNITAFTSFLPLLRSTWSNPERESAPPWLMWTLAYALLGVTTVLADQAKHPVLLVYPCSCVLLHGAIAYLCTRRRTSIIDLRADDDLGYEIGPSAISGVGVLATRHLGAGELVTILSGKPLHASDPDTVHPNAVGIAPDLWIFPDLPIEKMNHSCEANAAFGANYELRALRPITRGEEITLDYSTTEVDPHWTMECACGSAQCRRSLHAMQIAFAHHGAPPQAAPAMVDVWHQSRQAALLTTQLTDK